MTKLCECGCGKPAPIAKRTRRDRNWIKGHPKRFINGHFIQKQFCPKNHDTFVFGRTKGKKGRCSECERLRKRKENMTSEQINIYRKSRRKWNNSPRGYILKRKWRLEKERVCIIQKLEKFSV